MLLLYSYCMETVSSEKIEWACDEFLAIRVLTSNHQPDHSRISEFRGRSRKIEALQCNLRAPQKI